MSRLTKSLFLGALLVAAVGCDSSWGSSSDPAYFLTRLGGRVLDGNTMLPLSGVTVKICNFEATGSTDGDGHWFIELKPGISTGTFVVVTFERSGYGSVGRGVGIFPNEDTIDGAIQNRQFIDTGTTPMRQGEPLTVNVTRDGSPLANATVVAIPSIQSSGPEVSFAVDGTSECTDLYIVGMTNASGVATLPNLDPTEDYDVVVPPQDLDGDGAIDHWYGATWANISDTGDHVALNVESYVPDSGPWVNGTNLMRFFNYFQMPTGTVADDVTRLYYERGNADLNTRYIYQNDEYVYFDRAVVTANQSVQVVFGTPVEVSEPNFLYRNNLVSFADPDWNVNLRIDATATMLAGSGSTIFNFTPVSPLPANEVVTLNFIARSLINPLDSDNVRIDFYVPLGLPTIPVAVDNYNGSRDGSGGESDTYLRFNEAVEGFYKVIGYTIDGSSVTAEEPYEVDIGDDSTDQIINNQLAAPLTGSNVGQSGAVAGRHYTVRLRHPFSFDDIIELNDDTGLAVNNVTIEISVRNIDGVVLDTVVTLPVE